MIGFLIEYRPIVFAVSVVLWFGSFYVIIVGLCKAAKRGDDMAEQVNAERRLAPYGSQADEVKRDEYEARRLIAEATASIPVDLLAQWVEQ